MKKNPAMQAASPVPEAFDVQTEAHLSQAGYRALLEASAQIVWTAAPNGAVVEDSPSWRAFTGQSSEQLQGLGWLDALHPDDRERVRELWLRAVAERVPLHTEYRVRHTSGDWRWSDVRAVPVLNTDGSVREWAGMNTDVTERKRAEEAVRESEERYRTLFDFVPVAVYCCDAYGVIQKFNRRAGELWGREPDLGDTDERFCGSFKLFRPDGSFMPHDQCPMAEVVSGTIPGVRDAEVIIERPDGSRIVVVVNIRPLKNQRGELTGAINCFYDITERKKSEEVLREADLRKSQFLATLAHELRNPLAPIRNAVEILRRSGDGEQNTNPVVDMMQRQVGQMVRLVDDLLDLSRISRDKIELRREPIELESVIHHAVEAIRPGCESMGHELTVKLPPQPTYLNGDPIRLAQVVGNLLNNACKFTEKGGHIRLTVGRDGNRAVIRVQDTGIGIPAEQLPRVFDMFMQVGTSKRSRDGLGIGLTLVKKLVEMHGGTIEAHSAGAGQGSEFVVRLPVLSTPLPPQRRESSGVKPAATGQCRILVVDDNRDAAESLAMLLNLSGHEVHTAHDGLEAVETAAKVQPDVILLDIGLPKLDGYEAARRIREQQGDRSLILVALTGFGQDEDRRRSKAAEFDAHMVKPLDLAAFSNLLVKLNAR